MKVFLIIGKAYNPVNDRCLLTNVLKVFSNKYNAISYIRGTWPEAYYIANDEYGRHYVIDPNEKCSLRLRYAIEEICIEDL